MQRLVKILSSFFPRMLLLHFSSHPSLSVSVLAPRDVLGAAQLRTPQGFKCFPGAFLLPLLSLSPCGRHLSLTAWGSSGSRLALQLAGEGRLLISCDCGFSQ